MTGKSKWYESQSIIVKELEDYTNKYLSSLLSLNLHVLSLGPFSTFHVFFYILAEDFIIL